MLSKIINLYKNKTNWHQTNNFLLNNYYHKIRKITSIKKILTLSLKFPKAEKEGAEIEKVEGIREGEKGKSSKFKVNL